jgi:hypothetical protein
LALGLAVGAQAADSFTSVCISELLADNQHGLRDEDGDRSGWIELYNGGKDTVNLAGWFLTDNATNLAQWRFPAVGLLPDKYLVVFASAKARTNDLAHLHTNFRLAKTGSYLALVGPKTNVICEFTPAYPRQSADISYGRVRGQPVTCGYFHRPTPGKPNALSGSGFAPEVSFSQPSGTFLAPFTLQCSTRAPETLIRYTLDGSLPDPKSPTFKGPWLITNTTHLRARAFQAGLLPGPPTSVAYLLLHSNVLQFTSTLPVLIMDTFGQDRPASARSSCVHLSFFEPLHGATSLTNPLTFSTRGGFRVRGSSSAGMPQSGFAVHFMDEFNQEQHHSALGLPADSDWVLYAPNGYEPVMIHNPLIHQLSRDLGRYSARTRFLEVFLAPSAGAVTAAHYHGIYVLEEKIKIGKHRVAIDRLGPADLKAPEVTGGYLLKIDRLGPEEAGFSAGGPALVYVEPNEQTMNLPQRARQKRYLETFFGDFERALNGPNWKDPALGYPAYIDVDSWIDFHVLEVLSGNVDSLVLSTYLHKPRGGKLVFGPHWDFDRALGSTDGRDDNPRQWNTGPFFDAPWWSKLLSDPDFWQRWVDRWQALRQRQFSLTNLYGLIDRLAGELREAQPRQVQRWGLQPRGGAYQSEIDLLKRWLSNRVDFIDGQLVPPAHAAWAGFRLTLTGPTNASIYYTLDGSDPRLAQGAISAKAIGYTGPMELKADAQVIARARNTNQWQTGGPPASTPWSGPMAVKY